MRAARRIGKKRFIVIDAVAVVVVFDRRFYRFFGEHRAVQFMRGQPFERFDYGFVRERKRFGDRFAFYHFGCHRTRRDRAAAAERVEFYVRYNVVFYFEIYLHDVAAFDVADRKSVV